MIEDNDIISKQTSMSIPTDRVDIANSAIFLTSDESDYITGASIVVNGGWSVRGFAK